MTPKGYLSNIFTTSKQHRSAYAKIRNNLTCNLQVQRKLVNTTVVLQTVNISHYVKEEFRMIDVETFTTKQQITKVSS